MVILGVLGAVGLPNLLRQVSKAREAEAIAILGQINRAQQAYRYEMGIFARLNQLPIPISDINNAKFYTFSNNFDPTPLQSSYRAEARNPFGNEIRNYAGGVRLVEDGRLLPVICEAKSTSEDDVFVNTSGGCENSITLNDLSGVQQDTP